MRYRIIKITRALRIAIGGFKKMEQKHYLFTLPSFGRLYLGKTTFGATYSKLLTSKMIELTLWPHGWGYNTLSTTYRGQILTLRKPVPPRHQYHLRFYKDGKVSGHFEVDPVQFPLEHLDGVDLRGLTGAEHDEIKRLLLSPPQ